MRNGSIEQSTVVYRVTFGRMLPAIPIPGTVWFSKLVKALASHGLNAKTTELEAPTALLDDVVLKFSLVNDHLRIKLSYAWMEYVITSLFETDYDELIEIGNSLMSVLREIDEELTPSYGSYKCYAHLRLEPSEAEQFLAEHLQSGGDSALRPDAFAYEIEHKPRPIRIIVAKSSQFEHSLFLDLSIDYEMPGDPAAMLESINKDFERVIGLLGLGAA